MDLTTAEDQERSEKQRPGCPECAPGAASPHTEPDLPHIHLTSYGYLIYAPDHEHRDFIEEIRAFERRAGREDAAKEKVALLDALRRLRDHWYGRPGWTEAADTVDVLIDAFTEGQHLRAPREDVTP